MPVLLPGARLRVRALRSRCSFATRSTLGAGLPFNYVPLLEQRGGTLELKAIPHGGPTATGRRANCFSVASRSTSAWLGTWPSGLQAGGMGAGVIEACGIGAGGTSSDAEVSLASDKAYSYKCGECTLDADAWDSDAGLRWPHPHGGVVAGASWLSGSGQLAISHLTGHLRGFSFVPWAPRRQRHGVGLKVILPKLIELAPDLAEPSRIHPQLGGWRASSRATPNVCM